MAYSYDPTAGTQSFKDLFSGKSVQSPSSPPQKTYYESLPTKSVATVLPTQTISAQPTGAEDPIAAEKNRLAYAANEAARTGIVPSSVISGTKQVNIPPTNTATTAADNIIGGSSATQQMTGGLQEELRGEIAQKTTDTAESRRGVLDAIKEMLGISEKQTKMEEEAGVPKLTEEVAQVNSDLLAATNALNHEIRGIQESVGATAEQKQGFINEAKRVGAAHIADLEVIKYARTSNLAAIQSSIDKKISLMTERTKLMYQFAKDFYDENYADLKDTQKTALQLKIDDLKAQKDRQEKELQLIYETAVKAAQDGAPNDVVKKMMEQTTFAGAMGIGGQYVGALDRKLKQAQIAKLYNDMNTPSEKQLAAMEAEDAKRGQAMKGYGLVNSILGNNSWRGIFGVPNPFTVVTPGSAAQTAKAQYKELKAVLALGSRQLIKGTGQISDYESRTLDQSASALSRWTSDEAAEKEFRKVRGVLALEAGYTASVIVDGWKGEMTKDQLEQAMIQGRDIEFQ